MAEYVERDKLWDTFVNEPFYDNADREEIVLPIIDDFPAADVAPVVRCKVCAYRKTVLCNMIHETMGNVLVDYSRDDDYCSRGKRKDD